jgi:hypothetical protein
LTSYPIKKIWDSKQVKISPSFPSDGAMTHKKIFLNLYYIVRKLKFTHRRQIIQKKQAYLSDKVRFPETPETEDEEDLMIDALTVTKDGKYIVMSNI